MKCDKTGEWCAWSLQPLCLKQRKLTSGVVECKIGEHPIDHWTYYAYITSLMTEEELREEVRMLDFMEKNITPYYAQMEVTGYMKCCDDELANRGLLREVRHWSTSSHPARGEVYDRDDPGHERDIVERGSEEGEFV